jgi:hypothetical protein
VVAAGAWVAPEAWGAAELTFARSRNDGGTTIGRSCDCCGRALPRSHDRLSTPVARLSTAPSPIANGTPTLEAIAPVTSPPTGVEPAKTVV